MSGIFDQVINYSPPSLLTGTVTYEGTWSAATNTPTLPNPPSSVTNGHYYVVSAGGTQFSLVFNIGDWIISNGSAWEKVDNTDAVDSVFGRTGAVVGVSTDYSAVGITNTALGASNPSTVAATTITASSTIAATGAVTGSNLSGTNTGDQTITLTGGVTGSGTGSFAATVVTNANLTGDVTSSGNATTLTNAPVIAKVLTGYTSGAGTVAATDSILQAIQKLNGNDATNANLTGVITSSGNATSIASQTGTGTKFVVDTSPTLVTPNIGVATGTSLAAALNGSLGATTPSSVAATTGTFSSTLGVTGVATLGNGAILGTPASGNLASCTGYVGTSALVTVGALNSGSITSGFGSIDVGADAISGGAISGTTGSFTGVVQLGTAGGSKIATIGDGTIGGDSQLRLRPNPAELGWSIGGSTLVANALTFTPSTAAGGTTFSTPVATFTSTGLNSTAIGATTAAAGSFTTLGASTSLVSSGVTQITGGTFPSSGVGLEIVYTAGVNASEIQSYDRTGTAWKGINYGASTHTFKSSGSTVGAFSSTGLAVTGTLSCTTGANFATSSGSVGIGTASPAFKLDVQGANGDQVRFGNTTNPNLGDIEFYSSSTDGSLVNLRNSAGTAVITLDTRAGTNVIFNTGGNVGIGTTSPAEKLNVVGGNIKTDSGSRKIGYWETDAVHDGYFIPYNASGQLEIVNTFSTGAVLFKTGTSATERMRIDSNGTVNIGTTTALNSGGAKASIQFSGGQGLFIATEAQGGGQVLGFNYNITTNVGSVNITSTATTYTTSSDYRLKNIIGAVTDSGTFIDALKPKVGTWKVDGSKFVGFLAHEFAEVCPSAVIAEKDAVDTDGKPVYQSMQASSVEVIANLVAELQSLRKRLAALESK